MKRRYWLYVGFFIVLLGVFYFFLFAGTDYYKVKLPVLAEVKDFAFTDQNGKPVTERNVEGKVYVAEYFFTTCKGICPKLNTNMKSVYEAFQNEKGFAILSHTVDPETDTVARMKRYADSLGAKTGNWFFLTGKKDSLYHAARVSYLLDDPKNGNDKIEDQFIHTQFFALVDKSGRVRKIYDGLKKEELAELEKDIPVLLNEKAGGSFVNSLFSNNPN